jgi:hypothetical protein
VVPEELAHKQLDSLCFRGSFEILRRSHPEKRSIIAISTVPEFFKIFHNNFESNERESSQFSGQEEIAFRSRKTEIRQGRLS